MYIHFDKVGKNTPFKQISLFLESGSRHPLKMLKLTTLLTLIFLDFSSVNERLIILPLQEAFFSFSPKEAYIKL